jgi:hypothetical protein
MIYNEVEIEIINNQIKMLEEKRDMLEERHNKAKQQYGYLVGKYFQRGFKDWQKITKVNEVKFNGDGEDIIECECISLRFDPVNCENDRHNKDAGITLVERTKFHQHDCDPLITEERFREVFEEFVKYIRTKI